MPSARLDPLRDPHRPAGIHGPHGDGDPGQGARGDLADALRRLDAGPRREGEAPAEPFASQPPGRSFVAQTLTHWTQDADLAILRGGTLDALPAAEREAWRALCADVERLRKRAGERRE